MRYIKPIFKSLIILGGLSILVLKLAEYLSTSKSTEFLTSLSAISTAIAAIGGILLLFVTYFTFLETRQQRISKEEPVVTLRLVPDEKDSNFLNIVLKNSGGGAAYDLQIVFSPDLPYGDYSLNKLNMFNRMPLLDAGEEVVFFYDSLVDYLSSDNPKTVIAKVSHYTLPKENKSAKKISKSFELDFEERYGQMHLVKKDMNNLVNEIEELKNAIVILSLERVDKND